MTMLKYVSLFVLVFQNAGQVLIIRYTRTRDRKDMFLPSSAVFWTEVVKLFTCLLLVAIEEKGLMRCATRVYDVVVRHPMDTLKVCVPSFIYTVQNNLLYVAVSNLDAATFMVTYQLKILTTALFAVGILHKSISKLQWLALFVLFVGVSIVQIEQQRGTTAVTSKSNATSFKGAVSFTTPPSHRLRRHIDAMVNPEDESIVFPADKAEVEQLSHIRVKRASDSGPKQSYVPKQSPMLGLVTVIIACLMSGFAGIYFEKILKNSDEISVWMRNVQLAVLSIPIAYLTMMIQDGAVVQEHGYLYGYDEAVWACILTYALGGLTVAVVVKYADNILKGFATSISIVLSTVASMYMFVYVPSPQFLFGTALVIASVYMYSKPTPGAAIAASTQKRVSLSASLSKTLSGSSLQEESAALMNART